MLYNVLFQSTSCILEMIHDEDNVLDYISSGLNEIMLNAMK